MQKQVFLGGSCGTTDWRQKIAIPILQAAGVSYFDPQLPAGAWTPADQHAEQIAKAEADVWLFVINGQTRGVASVGEVAYRIGQGGKLALALEDIAPDAIFENRALSKLETDDLNRGRVFLRAMAEAHGVPVFSDIARASEFAADLAQKAAKEWTATKLRQLLQQVELPDFQFIVEQMSGQIFIKIEKQEINVLTSRAEVMQGRRWLIEPDMSESDVLRTLLKAALTWEEHEVREQFRFRGKAVFNPHVDL